MLYSTFTCQISSQFILSPSRGENPQFLPFFGLRHLVVSPVGGNLRNMNTSAQLQTFPYPTALKSFLYSNAFMAKSGAQTLTFKSVTDKQTYKQKTQRFWPPRRRVKPEPDENWHRDRGSPARYCTSKTFWVWRTVSPIGGAEIWGGGNQTLST